MSENIPEPTEEEKRQQEEAQIQLELTQKQYANLKKEDPRFIGIDLDNKEYWINGHGWRINKLGFSSKKKLGEYFNRHDQLVGEHDKLDLAEQSSERLQLMGDILRMRDEMIEVCVPVMLSELNGKEFSLKWFDDNSIAAAAWWDCIRDVFLFLRGRGSREDILLSMMLSNSVSSTTSNTSKTQTKSTSHTKHTGQTQAHS